MVTACHARQANIDPMTILRKPIFDTLSLQRALGSAKIFVSDNIGRSWLLEQYQSIFLLPGGDWDRKGKTGFVMRRVSIFQKVFNEETDDAARGRQ